MGEAILQQFMDLFFIPEFNRRKEAGQLPAGATLSAAQVIFHLDGRPPDIRLNDEIRAIADIRLSLPKGAVKQPGESILASEVGEVTRIRLTPDDDPDAGHATFVLIGDAWHIGFDFRYNKSIARRHLDVARQFLGCADFARSRRHWVPFVDNLYSAAELIAKATLLFIPDPMLRKSRKHQAIHSRYNRFASLGNVRAADRKTFNQLYTLRPGVRYLTQEVVLTPKDATKLLATVTKMLEEQDRVHST